MRIKIKKWKEWSKAYRYISVILIILFVIFLSGFILIRNESFQVWIKKEIIASVEKNLDATLSIGDISGNPFSYLVLKQIKFEGPFKTEAPQNRLSADELTLRFSIWQMLQGKIGFSSIRIQSPKAYIDTQIFFKHRPNWKTTGRRDFHLSLLELNGGDVTVVYLDHPYHLQNARLSGSFAMDSDITNIAVKDFAGNIDGLMIDQIRGKVSLSPKGIIIKSVQVTGKEIQLDLDGQLQLRDKQVPLLALNVNSERLPVDQILGFIPTLHSTPAVGKAQFHLNLSGPINQISGKGSLSSAKGEIGGKPFTNLSGQFLVTNSHIQIPEISINYLKGKLKLSGDAQLESQERLTSSTDTQTPLSFIDRYRIPFNLSLGIHTIDITEIPKVDPKLSGFLDGQIKVNGDLLRVSTLQGNGHFNWTKGKYHGIENMDGNADLTIQGDNLHFNNTRFYTPESDCRGTIDAVRLTQKNPKLEFLMNWVSRDVYKQRTIINLPDITGTGRGMVHGVSENFTPLKVDGKFQLDAGRFATLRYAQAEGTIYADRRLDISARKLTWLNDWPIDKAIVQIQMGNPSNPRIEYLQFTRIEAQNGSTVVTGNGLVDFPNQKMHFNYSSGKGYLVDLPAIRTKIPMINGTLSDTGEVTGWGDKILVTNRYTLNSPTVWGSQLSQPISGSVSIQNNQMQMNAAGAGCTIQGTVDYRKPDPLLNLAMDFKQASFTPAEKTKGLPSFGGKITGTLALTGNYSNLQLQGNLKQGDLKFSQGLPLAFGTGSFTGLLRNGNQWGQIEGNVNRVDAQLSERRWGLIAPRIKATWATNQPLTMDIQSPSGYIEKAVLGNTKLLLALDNTKMEIRDLSSSLKTSGAFALKGFIDYANSPSQGKFNLKGINLPLDQSWSLLYPDSQVSMSGKVDIESSLSGKFDNRVLWDGQGKLSIKQALFNPGSSSDFISRLKVHNLDNMAGNFTLHKGQFQLAETLLQFPRSSLKLKGSIGPEDNINLSLNGTVNDLGYFIEGASGRTVLDFDIIHTIAHPQIKGTLSTDSGKYDLFYCKSGKISVDLNDRMQGSIKGDFNRLKLGSESFESGEVELLLKDPLIQLKKIKITRKGAQSSVTGQFNTRSGEFNMDFDANRILLLRWLSDQPADWLEDSRLDLTARFDGNYKKRTGTILINKLEGASGAATMESDKAIRINWKGNQYTVEPFTLSSHVAVPETKNRFGKVWSESSTKPVYLAYGGSLKGSGKIILRDKQSSDYDLNFSAHKFSWPIFKGTEAIYDATFQLQDHQGKPKLSGKMNFYRTQITAPLFIPKKQANTGKVTALPELPIEMDILFSAESAIFFRHDLLDLEARGWIRFQTNSSGELEVTHELRTVGGDIVYRGKHFPITRVEVKHTDPRIFNPYLEALAHTRIRNIEIYLRVFGTLNDYEITLTSDPPYPQTDLLALLATGRTVAELKDFEKQSIPPQVAAGYASEQILNTLGNPMVKAVGIDNIGMEYDEVDNESKLKIQKNITKNLSVGYNVGLSKESKSNAQMEYKLNSKLSIVGRGGVNSVSKEASGSVDLEFRIPTK